MPLPSPWHTFTLYFVSVFITSSYLKDIPCSYITFAHTAHILYFLDTYFMWCMPPCFFHLKNVQCAYINGIDSKYTYQSFERLCSSCCHYSQNRPKARLFKKLWPRSLRNRNIHFQYYEACIAPLSWRAYSGNRKWQHHHPDADVIAQGTMICIRLSEECKKSTFD